MKYVVTSPNVGCPMAQQQVLTLYLGGGVVFHQVMLPTNAGANDNILDKGWEWLECWGNTPLMTFARNQEGEIMQKAFSGIMR